MVIPCKPDSENKIHLQTMTNFFPYNSRTCLPHLYKDSKENDHDGSGDEESFLWEVINQEDQGKTDCPSQATVGDDELVSEGHSVPPELVHKRGQQKHAF